MVNYLDWEKLRILNVGLFKIYYMIKKQISLMNSFALIATQKTGVLALKLSEVSDKYDLSPPNIYQKLSFYHGGILLENRYAMNWKSRFLNLISDIAFLRMY